MRGGGSSASAGPFGLRVARRQAFRMVVGAAALVVLTGVPWPPRAATVLVAAGSSQFTLTSPSMAVTNLVYAGTFTVTSGSTTLDVLRFTLDDATMTQMDLTGPCSGSFAVRTSVPSGATADLNGHVSLDVTSISFTYVVPFTFTPALLEQPPPGYTLPSATLTSVSMDVVKAAADNAALQHMATSIAAC